MPPRQNRKGAARGRRASIHQKEELFARHFIATGSATEAMRLTGTNNKRVGVAGAKMLARPSVKALIASLQGAIKKKLDVDAERVVSEYAAIGFADIRDVVSWEGQDVRYKNSSELTDAAAKAVQSVEAVTTETYDDDGNVRGTRTVLKIKMHPKSPALDGLARHLGMNKDPLADGLRDLAEAIRAGRERALQASGNFLLSEVQPQT